MRRSVDGQGSYGTASHLEDWVGLHLHRYRRMTEAIHRPDRPDAARRACRFVTSRQRPTLARAEPWRHPRYSRINHLTRALAARFFLVSTAFQTAGGFFPPVATKLTQSPWFLKIP
jgi:hypothetical protein